MRTDRTADRQVSALEALARRQDESIATMPEVRREITVNVAAAREETHRLREETRDLRDESRAQREALLRLIDRLGEGDA